ncbi:MAG TPA: DUF1109 domain-containing protein [Devosiaceae bacterium]
MTDNLIDALVEDMRPVKRGAIIGRLMLALALALPISAVIMLALLGLRPDMPVAVTTPIFWIKSGYTLVLAAFGGLAVFYLARPGLSGRRALLAALAAFAVVALCSAFELAAAPAEIRQALIMGSSALVCPLYIIGLSLPFLLSNLLLLRRLAPTNLALAGLAAGLFAGAAGAWVYSFHCTEETLPFLAIWYSGGIALVGLLGTLMGKWTLRW